MQITVVTNCTARKAYPPLPTLCARSLAKASTRDLAQEWKARLDSAHQRIQAKELYQGRAFHEATNAARVAGSPLHVVSAGVGLITEDEFVPPYSLTVSEGHRDSISRRVLGSGFDPADWWSALRSNRVYSKGLRALIRAAPNFIFVLAVSPGYIQLLRDDLLALGPEDLARIRLIGPRREADLPHHFRSVHMPYDDRLDGERSPIKGTEGDFPQRAAYHFVQMLVSRSTPPTAEAHKALIRAELADWPRKKVVVRKKLSEGALRRAIAGTLRECDDQWTRALRVLRDDRQIACEEKRFRRICKELLQARG